MTPVGSVGVIRSARDQDEVGDFIEVVDDRTGPTGGFYVLTWRGQHGFDAWVEGSADVDAYFTEAGYEVDWLSDEAAEGVRLPRQH